MTHPPTVIGCISRAERRVLDELMRDGATDIEIAHRLGLSPNTVKQHMKALMGQARCHTRTELAVALFRGQVRLHVKDRPLRERPQRRRAA